MESNAASMTTHSKPETSDGSKPDYEALFRRSQAVLMRLLLTSGEVWSAIESDAGLGEDLRNQLSELSEHAGSGPGGGLHARVLLACAAKIHEISGGNWKSDPEKLKISDFGGTEFIVKYPDLVSETSYYFRVVDDEVSPLLIE